MTRFLANRLQEILEPGAAALGFELVAVELSGRGRNTILRVYIDAPMGVTVEDCARVSRQLSAILDVEDPISEQYTLEVSSPGFDRPLRKREHFERVIGEQVKIRLHSYLSGRRRFTGVLRTVNDGSLTLEVDGEVYELGLEDIEKARLVPSI